MEQITMTTLIACDPPVNRNGPNVGGVHAVAGSITNELELRRQPVELITNEIFAGVDKNLAGYERVSNLLDGMSLDLAHIVTQSRLGLLVRRYCIERGLAFSTAYHTQLPEYLELRYGVPLDVGYDYIRWFCEPAHRVIAPTPAMAATLQKHGVVNAVSCLHGVDTVRFHPAEKKDLFAHLPGPIFLFVSRVSPEKSPEDFLKLNLPGTKVMVGGASGGLSLESLKLRYPDTVFMGVRTGDELAEIFRNADVFVFPSKTDTFGLVLLEALASGIPVAAYPVTGPIDVITDPRVGCLDFDLRAAALAALKLSGEDCRSFALQHSWSESVTRWLGYHTPCQSLDGKRGKWLDSTPHRMIEWLVGMTEQMLFADEPAGPYSASLKT
jgi:glycosyltransferase involved in cell wall biosynthesis